MSDARDGAQERALELVLRERDRQRARWGVDEHPDVGQAWWAGDAPLVPTSRLRALVEGGKGSEGGAGWLEILCEELGEARDAAAMTGHEGARNNYLLASNRCARRADLRRELVQVAAVALAWLEDLERRDAADEDAHG